MKKIIIFFIFLCFAITPTKANTIEKIVAQSNLGIKSSLGIYVINSDTNKEIYKKNEQKMLTPASTLKTLTFATSYKVLGENYKFSTEIYKLNNDIYLKLSGDTLLTSSDLVNLFKEECSFTFCIT